MKRIVIKIGSLSLIDRNGFVQYTILDEIMDQVIQLKRKDHRPIIVTSGAVALGRALLKQSTSFLNESLEKKIGSSLGQPTLLSCYQAKAQKEGFQCAQVLLTKDDFRTRERYLNIMYLFEGLLSQSHIIPIVNENDAVTTPESMFVDNDELSGLLASQVRAERLIVLTNVDGVYDKSPREESAQLIKEIQLHDIAPTISDDKSSLGRGGMKSKLNIALRIAGLGVETNIMNVEKRHLLSQYDEINLGTRIIAEKSVPAFKRWLSFSQGVGGVYVNAKAAQLLRNKEKVMSLLPVGVTEIEGNFAKNDVIYIFNEAHHIIAIGLASYDSTQLKDYIGQPHHPELVHYDHLYVY